MRCCQFNHTLKSQFPHHAALVLSAAVTRSVRTATRPRRRWMRGDAREALRRRASDSSTSSFARLANWPTRRPAASLADGLHLYVSLRTDGIRFLGGGFDHG
ncbi:hypothetical protein F2P81_020554 [Scophthalmus maximus]|uniref:Uncharacterized protein n=1 Tax=Scophthalmus maximus TaxID=52904 RepID=A0A6A4S0B5_SCOMX|nr:hypothetical protein F2P81_020554 [Scophthalmus maximus]